ncbi:RNA chaperone ProQ [Pseudoalteromonas sp. SSMSWG5]|jgi:ProP effector|uniref:RNA chaperone ProQ n=2 Tax=Pseudoalteromonas TaxID=53246 RepID=UPI000C4368F2|nr:MULTISPECIES: RNA chaperone ProQ [unclassified Pseudoalteromonas]MBU77031.1 RNA chaperone ProQ [Pseudoalteromonadaceae bacterium]HCV01048.1 RNA chaperone ProQ [Pseudoalteromonas sp.]MCF2900753.1 RNA chaperone ProQ [Pseudoalteromonas sp. OFAV1]MCF2919787.1 RNA chaperone ProQ [Pseudoalteromonas sp. APAL1]MCO7249271.1 RNA chaperone ProQ [Pseudoalteromonas sp. Ps84H-4]|tara:strand:- start:3145 stop:3795 length:651 start_codon:yes stop_codon:yes gene_type:complete
METTNKLKDINEVLDFLYQEFPQCFKQKDGIQPLKVGIFKDIAERIEGSEKVSKTQVRQALRKYTSNWRYLEAVTKSEFRIDLDGNQDEKVEQEHVEHAQKALEESRAKMAKRKKQQRPRKDGDTKSYKKNTGHHAKSAEKGAKVSNKPAKAAPAKRSGKVEPLPASEVKVNSKVKVKLGQALVNAVITEVNKDEVHVELVTGMQVKTKADSLYII